MSINIKRRYKLELKVRDFLASHANGVYARDEMAPHVARISLMMNHLYQDLGFNNRTEMGRFMSKHFPKLAQKKPKDVLWKKFIYDSIGEVAPACKHCKDSINCFACNSI